MDPLEGRVDPFTECTPCEPDATTISLGAFLGGTVFPGAVVTLDGNTFTVGIGIEDPESVNLDLFGTASLPALSDSQMIVTAPFSATGQVFAPAFNAVVPIRGRGIATLALKPFPAGASPETWEIDRLVRYDFANPVPEPATLTFVASGLAAIVGARTKRRGRRTVTLR